MQGKPDWIKKKAQNQSYGLTPEKVQNLKKHYAASVVAIDDCIGRILDVLEGREICQNTVVVFCADHGEMLGDHNLFQKSVMYEGALRIPLAVSYTHLDVYKRQVFKDVVGVLPAEYRQMNG